MPRAITAEQNEELVKQVEEIEVKTTLYQMHPDKAPGPDGMTPAFFQKHWKIVGKDIVDMVQRFFTSGELCRELNATNIVLIPKKKGPTSMGDLRPIFV